jgi:hypothetical protein
MFDFRLKAEATAPGLAEDSCSFTSSKAGARASPAAGGQRLGFTVTKSAV